MKRIKNEKKLHSQIIHKKTRFTALCFEPVFYVYL